MAANPMIFVVLFLIVAAVGGGLAWYFLFGPGKAATPAEEPPATPPVDDTGADATAAKTTTATFNGTYFIQNKYSLDNTKPFPALSLNGQDNSANHAVRLFAPTCDHYQWWVITPDPKNEGYYNIKNKRLEDTRDPFQYLSLNGQDALKAFSASTDSSQSWQIIPDPKNSGYYHIKSKYLLDNKLPRPALSLNGQDPKFETIKPLWEASDDAQAWKITPVTTSC